MTISWTSVGIGALGGVALAFLGYAYTSYINNDGVTVAA